MVLVGAQRAKFSSVGGLIKDRAWTIIYNRAWTIITTY